MISWWHQHQTFSESWIHIFDMIIFLGFSDFDIIRFVVHLNCWHDQVFGVLKIWHDQDFLILNIWHDQILGISKFEIMVSSSWHHHDIKILRSLLNLSVGLPVGHPLGLLSGGIGGGLEGHTHTHRCIQRQKGHRSTFHSCGFCTAKHVFSCQNTQERICHKKGMYFFVFLMQTNGAQETVGFPVPQETHQNFRKNEALNFQFLKSCVFRHMFHCTKQTLSKTWQPPFKNCDSQTGNMCNHVGTKNLYFWDNSFCCTSESQSSTLWSEWSDLNENFWNQQNRKIWDRGQVLNYFLNFCCLKLRTPDFIKIH